MSNSNNLRKFDNSISTSQNEKKENIESGDKQLNVITQPRLVKFCRIFKSQKEYNT